MSFTFFQCAKVKFLARALKPKENFCDTAGGGGHGNLVIQNMLIKLTQNIILQHCAF